LDHLLPFQCRISESGPLQPPEQPTAQTFLADTAATAFNSPALRAALAEAGINVAAAEFGAASAAWPTATADAPPSNMTAEKIKPACLKEWRILVAPKRVTSASAAGQQPGRFLHDADGHAGLWPRAS
jgi:hypothetical protein